MHVPVDAQESIDQMPLDLSDDDDETKPLPGTILSLHYAILISE